MTAMQTTATVIEEMDDKTFSRKLDEWIAAATVHVLELRDAGIPITNTTAVNVASNAVCAIIEAVRQNSVEAGIRELYPLTTFDNDSARPIIKRAKEVEAPSIYAGNS